MAAPYHLHCRSEHHVTPEPISRKLVEGQDSDRYAMRQMTFTTSTTIVRFGLFLALWPILIVHAAYAISASEGHAPVCIPYWDGCTSISRAGRHGWANHLFRAALLPYAPLLGLHWWLNQRWLLARGDRGSGAMTVAGWTGVLFLVLYLTFLGTEGPTYQLMRRYGINVYFGATFLAQVLLLVRLQATAAVASPPLPRWLVPALALLALAILAMGLLFATAGHLLPIDRDRLRNALEWNVALSMQLSLLLVPFGWRACGLHLQVGCGQKQS